LAKSRNYRTPKYIILVTNFQTSQALGALIAVNDNMVSGYHILVFQHHGGDQGLRQEFAWGTENLSDPLQKVFSKKGP